MSIVPDQLAMMNMPLVEGQECLVQSTNMRYRVMAGIWICVGMGAG
jgi:hypothetical protein